MGKLYAKKLDNTDETPKEVTTTEETPVAPNEKKLKALEKARERRQQKKAEQEALKKQKEEEEALAKKQEEEALAEKQKKKEAAAEKRRQARLAKKQTQEPTPSVASTEPTAEPVEPAAPPKKERKRKAVSKEVTPERGESNETEVTQVKVKRAKVDTNEPPKWFTTFLEGVKKEQLVQSGEKKSKADIKAEVQEHAAKAWNDGYTRDRIQNENDKHLGRMYSMMFSGRKL